MRIIEIVTTLQERQNEAEGGVHFEGDSLTSAFRCGKALAYADAIDLLKNFPLMLSDEAGALMSPLQPRPGTTGRESVAT